MKALAAILTALFMTACGSIQQMTDAGTTAVNLLNAFPKAKDTVTVKYGSVYFTVPDSFRGECEYQQDGYDVWQLRTDSVLRIEVRKLDTIIIKEK